jgi:hypothetical protein
LIVLEALVFGGQLLELLLGHCQILPEVHLLRDVRRSGRACRGRSALR